jgi:archaellum biogenesis ATPase FlaH
MAYVEVAMGKINWRGRTMPLQEVHAPSFARTHYGKSLWRSYFTFGEELSPYILEHKALNNSYPHAIGLDKIRLDYDAEDIEAVLETVRQVRESLFHVHGLHESQVQVWFSGRKGFHIDLPNLFGVEPAPNTPAVVLAAVKKLFKHAHLDTHPIFPAGMIRLPWSKHEKSGLYKVPLTMQELFTLTAGQIRELAAEPPTTRKGFPLEPLEMTDAIWRDATREATIVVEKRVEAAEKKKGFSMPDVVNDTTRYVTCAQTAFARGPVEGQRNHWALRLASWMRRSGLPKSVALLAVARWAEEQEPRLQQELVKKAEEGYDRYKFGCSDPYMSELCDSKCIFYNKKNYSMKLSRAEDMMLDLITYLKADKSRGFDLCELYGLPGRSYFIAPGEVVMVTGDTGLGKSTIVQNWISELGRPSVYLNLEMAEKLTFRRFIQMRKRLSKEELEAWLIQAPEEEAMQVARDSAGHISVLSISPELRDLERIMIEYQPEIMVIDTTDGISVEKAGNSDMAKLGFTIEEMRRLAQEHDIIVIGIHHINKSSSKEGVLDLNSLTGNRANVTKMDHVLGLQGDRFSKVRQLKTMKTRDGEPITIPLVFDTDRFRMEVDKEDNPWNHL